MNFASSYVYDNAADTEAYEEVSDEEYEQGMELSDSGSDEEREGTSRFYLPAPSRSEESARLQPAKASIGKSHHWQLAPGNLTTQDGASRGNAVPSGASRGNADGASRGKKRIFRRADTNVVSIRFDTLKKPSAMHAGEVILCTDCEAIMSHISSILNDGPDKIWRCEFCGNRNVVEIDEEEKPTADDVTYLVEPALSTTASGISGRDESIVIFCIDVSGSMTITTEVPGHMKLRGSETLKRLHRENRSEGDQHLPKERRDVTYISRLQAVQAAVDHQLGEMVQNFPHRRVALITFSCDVSVIGDGTGEEVTVSGKKLMDQEELSKIGSQLSCPKPIKETRTYLGDKIFGLEEGGSTALGPALIIALSMASQHPGSKIIICTDGKSNEGVGKVENLHESDQDPAVFFENVARTANDKGVSISVITIKGTDCRLIQLGKLADSTGGQVNIVDPLKLTEEFSNVLADQIIATSVVATFILHRGLYIGKEENEASKERREIGNVRADQEISFEYGVRKRKAKESSQSNLLDCISEVSTSMEGNQQEKRCISPISMSGVSKRHPPSPTVEGRLNKKLKSSVLTVQKSDTSSRAKSSATLTAGEDESVSITTERESSSSASDTEQGRASCSTASSAADIGGAGDSTAGIPSELPFQLQITYKDVDGTRALRVLTQKKPVTNDRKVAEKDINLEVLGVHTVLKSSDLALQGDYSGSRGVALMNQRLAWRSSRDEHGGQGKRKTFHKAFSHVKAVENRIKGKQMMEVQFYGRTHSDEEDDHSEPGDEKVLMESADLKLRPVYNRKESKPQLSKEKKNKMRLRSEELDDATAELMYKSRSSSSALVLTKK